jgi:polyhydroxyalkanoate synthesis regulator phasin
LSEGPGRPDPADRRDEAQGGVGQTLREAIERTLQATTGPASGTRDRAGELLDEVARLGRGARDQVARRGQGARDELARRGQDAGAELARRGQEAGAELAKRLEALERRLASIEESLRSQEAAGPGAKPHDESPAGPGGSSTGSAARGGTKSQAEG